MLYILKKMLEIYEYIVVTDSMIKVYLYHFPLFRSDLKQQKLFI